MIRAVMAVVLATALLATSVPAVETARREYSDGRVDAEVLTLERAIRDVHARDVAVRDRTAGPRRVVTVRLPPRSWQSAPIEYVAIGGPKARSIPAGDAVDVTWKLAGSPAHEHRVPGVRVVGSGANHRSSDPLILSEPGTHRLVVSKQRAENETVVTVSRLDSDR